MSPSCLQGLEQATVSLLLMVLQSSFPTPWHDDLFGRWSMWQLQPVPAPRARKKRRPDLYKLYGGHKAGPRAFPVGSSAWGEESRRRWDTHAHTHVFLCLSLHLNIQRIRRQKSRSPVGFAAQGRGVRGVQSTAPWQAGASGADKPAPQGHPEDFGSRLSQPCQPFKHPAHTH